MSRYTLLNKIAEGGMGEVYRASVAGVGGFEKVLVVKRIHPHLALYREFVTMFLNEARLAAVLNHPNIVQIFDLGEEDGTYFIAMEYVDGPNLQSLIRAATGFKEKLPVATILKIGALACEGLAYAHSYTNERGRPQHIVHRDISPDNILMSRAGAVKVADFGIARAASIRSETQVGTTRGKVHYLSPERLMGKEVDGRADIFALAVVLFQALTGTRPFAEGSTDATLKAIVQAPPPKLVSLRPDVPVAVQAALERALAKDPAKRPTAAILGAELEQILFGLRQAVTAASIADLVEHLCPRVIEPDPEDPEVLPSNRFDASGRLRPPPPPAPDLPPDRFDAITNGSGPPAMDDSQTQVRVAAAPAARHEDLTDNIIPPDFEESSTSPRAPLIEQTNPLLAGAPPASVASPLSPERRAQEQERRKAATERKPRRWGLIFGVLGLALLAAGGSYAIWKWG